MRLPASPIQGITNPVESHFCYLSRLIVVLQVKFAKSGDCNSAGHRCRFQGNHNGNASRQEHDL